MRELTSHLIMPLPLFFVIATATILFVILKRKKWAVRTGLLATLWLLIVSTPFILNLLIGSLENKYEVISIDELHKTDKPRRVTEEKQLHVIPKFDFLPSVFGQKIISL